MHAALPPLAPASLNPAQTVTKALRAAQDFEAMLLETLLGPLEETFSSLPGSDTDAGSSDYRYLGTQALASGLAASGGLGIGRMIIHNLSQNNGVTGHGTSPRTEVSGLPADGGK